MNAITIMQQIQALRANHELQYHHRVPQRGSQFNPSLVVLRYKKNITGALKSDAVLNNRM